MIKIENVVLASPEHMMFIIQGMRNPKNSWDRSDSCITRVSSDDGNFITSSSINNFELGENDHALMQSLSKAGTDHRKFMRMMPVYVRITAPLYWWSEFDTYKVGTVANSCSKMHKLLSKPFEMSDFSFDKLPGYKFEPKQYRPEVDEDLEEWLEIPDAQDGYAMKENIFENFARPIIDTLNELRDSFFNSMDQGERKQIWYSIIQLLPSSYNQTRNVMMNYEVLANMYKSRKGHKLDEWREFCKWIEGLPYSELITGKRYIIGADLSQSSDFINKEEENT